ncbi:autotransporter domain-containing protein [Fusobacterium sp. SB021]|uniref:autotransporter domain-containing protein n=1 Tax=Fusobacterium sp. SB021 TaxID=2744227 RepID=UPI003CF5E948
MGKSYVENSLKRFLKRKVKITLGLVVAFMITGMISFGADKPVEEMNDFEKAEYYLTGLNSDSNKLSKLMKNFKNVTNGTEGIELNTADNKIILKNFKNNGAEDIEITLKNENISNITAQNIKTALENGASNINNINRETLSGGVNNEIIINPNGAGTTGNSINNGIIYANIGQSAGEAQVVINNGIIGSFGTQGQYAGGNFAIAINNGIILGKKSDPSQLAGSKESTIINNGIIIGGYQNIQGKESKNKGYNYGIIENGYQRIEATFSSVYNYGIIKNEENQYGQSLTNSSGNSVLKNYGLIVGRGQTLDGNSPKNNIAENYGVINTAGKAIISYSDDSNKGFNYGTIISSEYDVFNKKTITNKGLVFLTNHEKGTNDNKINVGTNKGIIIDKNGAVTNNDTVAEYTGGNKNITNTFTDSKTTAYITGTGNKITENLSDKVVGTVVENENSVFTADKDLTLTDTVITGYFKNSGTLLDMGNNNLTLLGDTKIVASRDNFNLDAVALKINGNLKTLGGAEVAGKIVGEGNIINVAVNENNGTNTVSAVVKEAVLQNAAKDEIKYLKDQKEENNYTNIIYSDLNTNKVTLDFAETATGKENTVTFTDNLLIKGKDGVAIGLGENYNNKDNINLNFSSLDSEKVQGDILLGASDDDIVVEKNGKYNGIVNMGAGNDTFTVSGFAQSTTKAEDNHKELGTFDYKLAGVETITLKGNGEKNQGWHIGENASLSDVNGATLKVENTELHVDMNNNYGKGNVTTSLDKMASGADLSVTTGKDAEVRFVVGDKFNVSDKQFEVAHDYSVKDANLGTAVIFKGTGTDGAVEEKDGKISLTVKEASEVGLSGYEGIYNAVLKGLSKDDDLRNAVNYQDESNLVSMIKTAGETAEAFYTTGYAVTKDVTDTYMSVVEDFGRKAGKGEWIAYGKYVNSDTEFDGGKSSKGYDGDITGTVGMIEYGVNETTSYGVVYGQGDTEVDIQGGGKLDGDNTYFGGYVKHRTQNGIDLTGNIGITKSELDLSLATNTKTQGGVNHHIITDGNSDADALTFSIKGTKDYKVTDTIRLQPVVSGRYSFISQDEVTSSDANFKMDEQDITIFEGAFGGNIIKDFDIYNGRLSLSAGAEYVLTDVNKDDNARYHLYNEDLHFTGEEDIADNRIEGHIGIDYEHESGVGVDAKYEMIWTDKGDNSRVTAGISYRF